MKSIKNNAVFVRSILDLGDYNDDERNTEPSLTDPSQDEPIEALVARMLRGEVVGNGMPQFDTEDDSSAEDVFSLQADTSKDGFDLADAPAIIKRGIKASKALKKEPKAPVVLPEAEKPQVEAPKPLPEAK